MLHLSLPVIWVFWVFFFLKLNSLNNDMDPVTLLIKCPAVWTWSYAVTGSVLLTQGRQITQWCERDAQKEPRPYDNRLTMSVNHSFYVEILHGSNVHLIVPVLCEALSSKDPATSFQTTLDLADMNRGAFSCLSPGNALYIQFFWRYAGEIGNWI